MTEPKDEQMTDNTISVEPDETAVLTPEPTPEPTPDPTPEPTPDPAADLEPTTTWVAAAPEPAVRRGPSVPTIVWGVIFALVAAGVIAAQTTDVNLNLDVTAPAALLVLGVVLVAWGIAGLGRSRLRR